MGRLQQYPNAAGWTAEGTSKRAALEIEASGRAGTIRERLEDLFNDGWRGSTEKAAIDIDVPYRSIQPRFSELSKQGKIEKVGETRGEYGKMINIWAKTIPLNLFDLK